MGGDAHAKPAAETEAKLGSTPGLINPYAASYSSTAVTNVKKGLFFGGALAVGTSLGEPPSSRPARACLCGPPAPVCPCFRALV